MGKGWRATRQLHGCRRAHRNRRGRGWQQVLLDQGQCSRLLRGPTSTAAALNASSESMSTWAVVSAVLSWGPQQRAANKAHSSVAAAMAGRLRPRRLRGRAGAAAGGTSGVVSCCSPEASVAAITGGSGCKAAPWGSPDCPPQLQPFPICQPQLIAVPVGRRPRRLARTLMMQHEAAAATHERATDGVLEFANAGRWLADYDATVMRMQRTRRGLSIRATRLPLSAAHPLAAREDRLALPSLRVFTS
jgi:hypothetical protein